MRILRLPLVKPAGYPYFGYFSQIFGSIQTQL